MGNTSRRVVAGNPRTIYGRREVRIRDNVRGAVAGTERNLETSDEPAKNSHPSNIPSTKSITR